MLLVPLLHSYQARAVALPHSCEAAQRRTAQASRPAGFFGANHLRALPKSLLALPRSVSISFCDTPSLQDPPEEVCRGRYYYYYYYCVRLFGLLWGEESSYYCVIVYVFFILYHSKT